ncbi:hypothetical protein ACJJTC_019780 [Scirpophaga incertulas]
MNKDSDESSTRDPQELQLLTVKRSSIKGRVTKFKNYLKTISAKESLSTIELGELTLKLSKFELLLTQFDELQGQIEILNYNALSEEIDERDDIEQIFITNITIAREIINKHKSICNHAETIVLFVTKITKSTTVLLLRPKVYKIEFVL